MRFARARRRRHSLCQSALWHSGTRVSLRGGRAAGSCSATVPRPPPSTQPSSTSGSTCSSPPWTRRARLRRRPRVSFRRRKSRGGKSVSLPIFFFSKETKRPKCKAGAYLCREGLARFATVPYEQPNEANAAETRMHVAISLPVSIENSTFGSLGKGLRLVYEDKEGTMESLLHSLAR